MKSGARLLLLAVLLASGIAIGRWAMHQSGTGWQSDTAAKAKPPSASPVSAQGPQTGQDGLKPKSNNTVSAFSSMGFRERNAVLDELLKNDLNTIFDLMLKAGREEHDRPKQLAIQSALAFEVRKRKTDDSFILRLRKFVAEENGSTAGQIGERMVALGVLGGFPTRETIQVMIELVPSLRDPEVRATLLNYIGRAGAIWDDGTYHNEMGRPLEEAWNQSSDQELLSNLAKAMAELGAPDCIELLLGAALGENGVDQNRQQYARQVLPKIFAGNAVPPVAARLSVTAPKSDASQTAAQILSKIGDATAAHALINWLRASDGSAASFIPELVTRSATPLLLDAWQAALQPEVTYRSEANREAIRAGLKVYQSQRRTEL